MGRYRDRVFALGLSAGCALLAAAGPVSAAEPDPAAVQTRIAPGSAVFSKLILQRDVGTRSIATWSQDDRFVVTVDNLSRTVLVWDTETGDIVNRFEFPAFDPKANVQVWEATADADNVLTLEVNIREPDSAFCTDLTMRLSLAGSGDWEVLRGEPMAPCMGTSAITLVPSHDGLRDFDLSDFPITIRSGPGAGLVPLELPLEKPHPTMAFAAAMSPDGKRLAMIGNDVILPESTPIAERHSQAIVFDLTTWKVSTSLAVAGFFTRVGWLDDERLILSDSACGLRGSDIPPSSARIIAATGGHMLGSPVAFRCDVLVAPDGAIFSAGFGNALERYDPELGWQAFGQTEFAGNLIELLVASPDGRKLAVISNGRPLIGDAQKHLQPDSQWSVRTVRLFDTRTGVMLAESELPDSETYPQLSFSPDSKRVGLRLSAGNYRWDLTNAAPVLLADSDVPIATMARQTMSSDGQSWYEQTWDYSDGPIAAVRIADGEREARLLYNGVLAEGPIPDSPLRWVVTSTDGFVVWRPNAADPFANPEVLRTYLLDNQHFFSLAPDGRYDTDLGADTDNFRWNVSDAPLWSFGPQTFMRNFFEPRLGPRLMACHLTGACAAAFRPVTAIADLNRVQPGVTVTNVTRGPEPDTAVVEVVVASRESNPDMPTRKAQTDGYDLRLFRDGSLVGQLPGGNLDAGEFDLAEWRRENWLVPNEQGLAYASFKVRLPTNRQADDPPIRFSAYAFNEDRVKSETAFRLYQPPKAKARARRVFVVAIGVDDYAEARLKLDFAAGDARLLGSRLADLPGDEDVRLLVMADDGAAGSPNVSRAAIADVFGILGGAPRANALARLKAQGIDARMLDQARPDDIVIISFSGHGWTDPQGTFYLAPAEARWSDPTGPPDIATLVSSAEMSRALRLIDAGEMALIIDACHSAASVDAGGFRAGPMGDSGLGQLAFDKQMRVLAATQADDVALESNRLRQGLLTYALANEGITADGGLADEDGDGAITLDEWLRYATGRLPSLSRDVKLGRLSGEIAVGRGIVLLNGADTPSPVQQPSLFDFTGSRSRLALRRLRP